MSAHASKDQGTWSENQGNRPARGQRRAPRKRAVPRRIRRSSSNSCWRADPQSDGALDHSPPCSNARQHQQAALATGRRDVAGYAPLSPLVLQRPSGGGVAMGDLRAASHQRISTLTTAPLKANATPLLEPGFRWLRLSADQTFVSKNTIGAGDASRHAQSIGKSPPQVQSTLCSRCHAPATSMRAGRCLTVVRLIPNSCM